MIRREVSRDGSSNYYLNATKCRRKDIREVFLGTGLGPRSYAIIEQGMICRTNVGKSLLFNKLTKARKSLVADYHGVTRDINAGYISRTDFD